MEEGIYDKAIELPELVKKHTEPFMRFGHLKDSALLDALQRVNDHEENACRVGFDAGVEFMFRVFVRNGG